MKKGKIRVAAVVFALAVPVFSAGCSDSIDNDNNDNNNNNIDFGEITEYTQTTENDLGNFSEEPVIGGDFILSQDTKGDLTATLNILNISHLPDGSEENNYYGGEYLMVRIRDNKSGITVGNTLPKAYFSYDDYFSDSKMKIDADIALDSVELLGIEDNGKTEYILKVEYYQESNARLAAFASCDTSGYGETGGLLKWYSVNGPYYSDNKCIVSPSFTYMGGRKFSDNHLELVYEFDTEELQVTVRVMDTSDMVFSEPEIGKNSILSECTLGEYSAAVEIHNIIGLPPECSDPNLGGIYTGDKLYLKLFVNDKAIAYGAINYFIGGESVWDGEYVLQEKCTGEGATRIFQVEQNGEIHYIVMQYSLYDKESDMIGARFACFDPEAYDKLREPSSDEAVSYLLWYDVRMIGVKTSDHFYNGEIQVSDAFEYVGEGVFRDSVYGYEIRFDCETLEAKASQLKVDS